MLKAAEVMGQNPVAVQLRYLQTLNTISAERNSTIVFPVTTSFPSRATKQPPAAACPHLSLQQFLNSNNPQLPLDFIAPYIPLAKRAVPTLAEPPKDENEVKEPFLIA